MLEPWIMNGRGLAQWLGVSEKTVSVRAFPSVGKDGRSILYDVREIIRIETARGLHAVEADGGVIDHEAEKARLTKARRIAQEFDNAESEKRLRPVEEVEAAITDTLTPVCAMLDALPMSIKRVCPELSQRAVEMVEREIAKARNQLADDVEAVT